MNHELSYGVTGRIRHTLMKLIKPFLLFLMVSGWLSSCETTYLGVTGVAYQSLQSANGNLRAEDVPMDATIITHCIVDEKGKLTVLVQNNSDQVMTIDRTKTFFRNQSGNSTPYYDPTVRTSTQSTTTGKETGGSVNLGAIAGAVGIGGMLGTALNGVNVGGSNSNAVTNSNTTYYIDQPTLSIAPHGRAELGRTFDIEGVGRVFMSEAIAQAPQSLANSFAPTRTYAACNVCVSYSVDGGRTFDTCITDIFANTLLVGKVAQTGRVNDALRYIYLNKADCLREPWHLLYFSGAGVHDQQFTGNDFINFK